MNVAAHSGGTRLLVLPRDCGCGGQMSHTHNIHDLCLYHGLGVALRQNLDVV